MLQNWLGGHWFKLVHGNNLVYNTCWEDPRLDRVALQIGPTDTVLVITSAGCNALDYVLQQPQTVHAVDMNPRQNALLELKLAGIRRLDYEDFFELFGRGRLGGYKKLYQGALRQDLSPRAQRYWDRRMHFFRGKGWRGSFYFYGTSGTFARLVNTYIDRWAGVRTGIMSIVEAESVAQQRECYDQWRDRFWRPMVRWAVRQDATLALLGVPRAQREQIEKTYHDGIAGFVEDCVEAVFAEIPFRDNYFWRVYLTGSYTQDCCPEYLKPENFQRLKEGLIDRIQIHTSSILDFLDQHQQPISRYVLLDHMDWLSTIHQPVLQQEWQALIDRAAPRTRIIWRSGGLQTDFVDRVPVVVNRQHCQVQDVLRYDRALAQDLHAKDRVHTYGSFHIAELLPA